jgi:hypothetical protein
MAETTSKLTILATLRDEASQAMQRMGNVASDLAGSMGFAADKTGILAGGLAAIGGSAIMSALNAFNSAQSKMDQAEGIFNRLPDGAKKFQEAVDAGNKAQRQFGFDNETATLSIAKLANAAGGDMVKAMAAFQAAMGYSVQQLGGPDGLSSATDALLKTFAGGSRVIKALGFDMSDQASPMTAFQTVIDKTKGSLEAWGTSAEGQKAIIKANLGDTMENLGEPFGKTQGWFASFINSTVDMQRANESAKPFIEGIGISLAGMSVFMAAQAIPALIKTAAGFLGLAGAAELTAGVILTTVATFAAWVIAIGLVIGAGIYVVTHWGQVKTTLLNTWDAIKSGFLTAWNAVLNWLRNFPTIVGVVMGTFVVFVVQAFEAMGKYLAQTVPVMVSNLAGYFAGLPGMILSAMASLPDRLSSFFQGAINNIKSLFSGLLSYIASAPGSIIDFGKSALNGFVDVINKFVKGFNSVSGKVGISLPEIPKFANGGIVTGPTIGLIGEAGPEAIIPLSRAGSFGLGGGGITVVLQGDFYTDSEIAERFGNQLAFVIKNQLNLAGIRA